MTGLLHPGMNIKRWILLLLFGLVFVGLGIAYILLDLFQNQPPQSPIWYITLRFIESPLIRGLLLGAIGILVVGLSLFRLNRSLARAILPNSRSDSLMTLVYERQTLDSKPRVVVFGSGIGLLILLNAIRDQVSKVDVVLPMGEDVQLYRELLSANQLILRDVLVSRILNATICAETDDGLIIEGFLAIKKSLHAGALKRLFPRYQSVLEDSHPVENGDIVNAVAEADAIIFGPSSLYVGIIPCLLASDVSAAIARSNGEKIYVCNIMTEPGKTEGYSVSRHVSALEQHGKFDLDYIILNNRRVDFELAKKYHDSGADQVLLEFDEFENTYLRVNLAHRSGEVRMLHHAVLIEDDLINAAVQKVLEQGTIPRYEPDTKLVVRHDSEKLKTVFKRVFEIIAQRPRVSV